MIDGVNLYRYGRNNPVEFNDPGGMDSHRESESEIVTDRNLMFHPLSNVHLRLNSNLPRPTLAFAGDIQFAETQHITTFDLSRRPPSSISAGAYLRSGYMSFNSRDNSLHLGADFSVGRHFSGLGSFASDYRLQATVAPGAGKSSGGIDLLHFSGNVRESLYGLDFSGSLRLGRPIQDLGSYTRVASDLISNLNSGKAFLNQISTHAIHTFGLELNFSARLNLLNTIPSTWIWGRLGDATDITAAGLVAAPAGSLFDVTAPLVGLYTTHTRGDRSWELLGGGLVAPSIGAITSGKSLGEMFPTYGFVRGSLSFSDVNLGLGPGTLSLSAEGAVSVNDLLNPPSREPDFNKMLDIIRGGDADTSAALKLNLGLKYQY
jgi:hypothetical protein